ncbi:MAG: hypothetical protein K0S09_3281 [Sphingobacteriaceae bacterium]|nr:hypothetical protein [Sphingobacteriaceae bacterium]
MKRIAIIRNKAMLMFSLLICTCLSAIAQDAADSDMSNRAGTNKNWREGWMPFALLGILILFIIFIAYRRKRRRIV